MNLAELAERSLDRLGERTNLVFEGEPVTNRQTLERARRLQRAFAGLGLGRGETAVLCMINHPLVYSVFQGVFRAGATAVPVMFQATAPELRFVLEDTRARVVVTDTMMLPKVREAAAGLDFIKWIAVREGLDDPGRDQPELRLETLLEDEPQTALPAIDPGDVALMLYTSGTTGRPKGVMLTHANLLASAEAANDAAELDRWEGPRIAMSAMPMAHIFGIGVMNSGYMIPDRLADACTIQLRWFEPASFMESVQRYGCTTMASVPTMLALILNHPRAGEFDLSSLREVLCGAAPLPVELARAFMERHGCRIREIYGMTENAGIGSANRLSDPYRPGSAGRAYCNTEVRVVDEQGRTAPPGQRGEIVTRGPTTMKGYHNRPEATAETIRDGWLHTGDVGIMDEEGYLYIVDRMKDMIIRGGENIYPAEIEEVLYAHAEVAEAAVVGAPDEVYGESVIAFVVRKNGSALCAEGVIEHCAQSITAFKMPARVHFIDALPKSGVGKILRRELRDRARQGV